jgi:hypothetical protein
MSPSKVFERIGQNVAQGFRNGIDQGMQGFQNPFDPNGDYFSSGAGGKVTAGFSLNGARSIEQEPWYAKWQALFPEPTPPKDENPFGEAFANEQRMILAAADKWVNPDLATATNPYPYQPPTQGISAGPSTERRTFSYDESRDPTDITLVVQDSVIVGRGGMQEFMGVAIEALARDARIQRLMH